MKLAYFASAFAVAIALAGSVAMAGTPGASHATQPTAGHLKLAATSGTSAARCTALQTQFDTAIKTHETAKKAAMAKALRQEGGQLCASGKTSAGVKKLEQALRDIGVKPMKTK